jgi:hypothetical protein
MSTTTIQMVELQFEEDIYASKEIETTLSDVDAGIKSMIVAGKGNPSIKLRGAYFIDSTGAQHELITREELKTATSLHLFFQKDPDKP